MDDLGPTGLPCLTTPQNFGHPRALQAISPDALDSDVNSGELFGCLVGAKGLRRLGFDARDDRIMSHMFGFKLSRQIIQGDLKNHRTFFSPQHNASMIPTSGPYVPACVGHQ